MTDSFSTPANLAIVQFCGQPMRITCDRRCDKAWGINARPTVQLSDDEDDFAYLADVELGTAPVNPGSSEGGEYKPLSPDQFPNKWCVRECERCAKSMPGKWDELLPLKSFHERVYNRSDRNRS